MSVILVTAAIDQTSDAPQVGAKERRALDVLRIDAEALVSQLPPVGGLAEARSEFCAASVWHFASSYRASSALLARFCTCDASRGDFVTTRHRWRDLYVSSSTSDGAQTTRRPTATSRTPICITFQVRRFVQETVRVAERNVSANREPLLTRREP